MMNENELFREATLRICGNLEIDEALRELLLFLQGLCRYRISICSIMTMIITPCGPLPMPASRDMASWTC